MAYVAGYDCDIFISYSHDDNEPIADRAGWVEVFHKSLENWLVKRRGLKHLSIWRDRKLQGNTVFDEAICNRIQGAALFFVLNSRNYVQSEYCRKELEWFRQSNIGRPGDLNIGEQHRIFNLLLNNIPHPDWPPELQGTVGFPLHDAQRDDDLGEFTEPSDDNFLKQLGSVVDAVEETLNQSPKARPMTAPDRAAGHSVKIFVADVSDSLDTRRDRLVSDLKAATNRPQMQVLDELPPPAEAVAHAARMQEILRQADLTVHLFDRWPGHRIVDQRGSTYPRVQMELALPSAVPTIVWVPASLDFKMIEDENHRQFLDRLENGAREKNNYEFVREAQIDLTAFILQKIATFQPPQNWDHGKVSLLVDSHQKDQRFAYELAAELARKGADVDFTKESSNPIRSLENFEEAIRRVKHLIVMFGQVAPAWLLGRIRKAIKIFAEQFDAGEATLEGIWVYRLPRCTSSLDLPQRPLQVQVLDNSKSESLDPKILTPLLSSLS